MRIKGIWRANERLNFLGKSCFYRIVWGAILSICLPAKMRHFPFKKVTFKRNNDVTSNHLVFILIHCQCDAFNSSPLVCISLNTLSTILPLSPHIYFLSLFFSQMMPKKIIMKKTERKKNRGEKGRQISNRLCLGDPCSIWLERNYARDSSQEPVSDR